jgi:tetratricopeptide (TPR) repeat protein
MFNHTEHALRSVWTKNFVPALVGVVFLCCMFSPARAGLPVQADPVLEARIDSLVRAAVEHAYNGRLDLGFETVDMAEKVAANDPRIGLTRYRLLRENYPVSVYQKERARRQAPAMFAALDKTIACCDSLLVLDETNVAAYLYRGWAWINKAQTHLIARQMRATAGAARKGNDDFEKFYMYQPAGDPDADTVWGSYLYFADTLPGFFKFIRWVIRVPGGDRGKGLELMRSGAAGKGYSSRDAIMILAVTYYLFDGNLEEARPMLVDAVGRHPRYPWLVEYTSSMSFVEPVLADVSKTAVSEMLEGWGTATVGWDDAVNCRMEWRQARLLDQLGEYDRSLVYMAAIVDENPSRAPWLLPIVRTAAMETAGRLGESGNVERWCAEQPDTRNKARDRGDVRRGQKEPDCPPVSEGQEIDAFIALGRVRTALYTGQPEDAAVLLSRAITSFGENLHSRFLQGELARSSGDFDEALVIFEALEKSAQKVYESSPVGNTWVRDLRVQTLIQTGEIYIKRREYNRAKDFYEKAGDTEPDITLYANVIRGRLSYLERQLNETDSE